jgi:hypothetical protein
MAPATLHNGDELIGNVGLEVAAVFDVCSARLLTLGKERN